MVSLTGSYNIWIVALSFIIAFFTSYQALGLTRKITMLQHKITWAWLIIAGFVMGCGIWTMHFVGMIAFHLPIPVDYHFGKSIVSVIASIGASMLAFYVTSTKVSQGKLLLASLFMASGIVTMHYVGMSSMKSEYMTISYDPTMWATSAVVAFFASYAALNFFVKMKTTQGGFLVRAIAALFMAIAVTGMHYVGMEASSFWCIDPAYIAEQAEMQAPAQLLIIVLIAIVVIILLTWLAQMWEQLIYKRMAYTDSLTGLNNRHAMNEYFKITSLKDNKLAILFIDLDQFKYINDTLGHDVGDLLIQHMGAKLKKHAMHTRSVFRMGGDEFMIVLPYNEKEEVLQSVQELLEEIRTPVVLGKHQLEITGSIGVSYAVEHGITKNSLLKAADTAMYYAKNAGKNQYCEYNDEMEIKVIRRMEIEKGLREALTKKTFQIYYQPKWNISTNRPIGFEALLRYTHPVLGAVAPDEFIPIAEETGLILPITEWVLQRACQDCYDWNMDSHDRLVVSVNLSSKIIESDRLYAMTKQALEQTSLAPQLLEVEITEQMMISCGISMKEQIEPLQQLGVKLTMDNFGSGYSFFGSLEQLQFHTLKIDKQYIEHYELPAKRAIVNSIVGLAEQLHIQLVAEGVETESQLKFLESAGCHVMQGFYFKKPMPIDEVEAWIKQL